MIFKASQVDWTMTPVVLAGGDLVRVDIRGSISDYASTPDWYIAITNASATYTWPT